MSVLPAEFELINVNSAGNMDTFGPYCRIEYCEPLTPLAAPFSLWLLPLSFFHLTSSNDVRMCGQV